MAKHRVNWHFPTKHKDYRAGDFIEMEATEAAPYVGFGVLTPLAEEEAASEVADLSAAQLKTMTKDQIAEYARAKFSVELKPADSTKDAMLAAVAVCAADATRKAGK